MMLLYYLTLIIAVVHVSAQKREKDCRQIDLVLIVDSSGSVETVFSSQIDYVKRALADLPIGDNYMHVSLVTFSEDATLQFDLSSPSTGTELWQHLDELQLEGGSTNVVAALQQAYGVFNHFPGARPNAQRIVLLVTDGHSKNTPRDIRNAVRDVVNSDAVILAATSSERHNLIEFNMYTHNERRFQFTPVDISLLNFELKRYSGGVCIDALPPSAGIVPVFAAEQNVVEEVPTLATTTTTTAQTTPRTASAIVTTTTRAPITTSPVPQPGPTPRPTIQVLTPDCATDFFLVLDGSGSVKDGFARQLEYIKSVVEPLVIGPNLHRIAVLEYSSASRKRVMFGFEEHASREEVVQALDAVSEYSSASRKRVMFGFEEHASREEVVQALDAVSEYSSASRKRVMFGFEEHASREEVVQALDALPYFAGTTETGAALALATDYLEQHRRRDHTTIVHVLTDGFSWDEVGPQAERLRSLHNVQVTAISLNERFDRNTLIRIAGTEQRIFIGTDYSELLQALHPFVACNSPDHVVPIVQQRPQFAPRPVVTSRTLPSTVQHAVATTSTTPVLTTTHTTTTTTTPLPTTTTERVTTPIPRAVPGCEMDIMLVIDGSDYSQSVFPDQLALASDLVDKLVIDGSNTHVALLKYAGTGGSKIEFGFTNHFSNEKVKNAIGKVKYMGGAIDLGEGLDLANIMVAGSRPWLRPTVILFSDGHNNSPAAQTAAAALKSTCDIYVVGLHNGNADLNLPGMLSLSGHSSRVFTAEQLKSLIDGITSVSDSAKCSQFTNAFATRPATDLSGPI